MNVAENMNQLCSVSASMQSRQTAASVCKEDVCWLFQREDQEDRRPTQGVGLLYVRLCKPAAPILTF